LQIAGIRALVDARRTVMSLALVNIPENVYRVIELSGTTDFFAIYDSEETALSALNSH
jgi:anti-anti-sigma regulatory factor